jgi:hypothetical protein
MKKLFKKIPWLALFLLFFGFVGGMVVGMKRGIPFVTQREQWTIGIYRSNNPFQYNSLQGWINPLFRAEDVTDVPAKFVADPFLVKEGDTWNLFFEVYNNDTQQGDLAVATSKNTWTWKYERVILDEPFHLSYPYVFKWEGEYYLIPESYEANSIRLYKARDFPYNWDYVATIIEGRDFLDNSIAYHNGKWWLFTSQTGNDILRLYYADKLLGPWTEHPQSPIVEGDANIARPGGRVLILEDRIYRYTQDSDPSYGNKLWAFEITELTPTNYSERLVTNAPVLEASGSGWNGQAMHQIDPVQVDENSWIAAVDGFGKYWIFGWDY